MAYIRPLAGALALVLIPSFHPLLSQEPREPIERYILRRIKEIALDNGIVLEAAGITWNAFHLSATMHGVSVASAAAPDFPAIATFDRATVRIGLEDAVHGAIRIDSVVLDNVRIRLVVDERGRNNIPKIPKRPERERRIEIDHINIGSGSFVYEDRQRRLLLRLPSWQADAQRDLVTDEHLIRFETLAHSSVTWQGRVQLLDRISGDVALRDDGIRIESSVFVKTPESDVVLTGALSNFDDLKADLEFASNVDLLTLLEFFGVKERIGGTAIAKGKATGDLDRLRVQARVEAHDVSFRQFRDIALSANVDYSRATNRVRLKEFDARSPLGHARGDGTLALTRRAGESLLRARVDGADIEAVMRLFDTPVRVASRAEGPVTLRWPGFELSRFEAESQLSLTATRSVPAPNLLPASGTVSLRVRDRRIVANLQPLLTMASRLEGPVTLLGYRDLGGELRVQAESISRILRGLQAFLGRRQPLFGVVVDGPLSASVRLEGTLRRPAFAATVVTSGATVAQLQGIDFDAQVRYADKVVTVAASTIRWREQLAFAQGTVDFRGRQPELNLTANVDDGEIQSVLRAFGQAQIPIEGTFFADFVVTGPVQDPLILGTVQGDGLKAYGEDLGEFWIDARLEQRILTLEEFRIRQPTGGALAAQGSLALDTSDYAFEAEGSDLLVRQARIPDVGFASGVVTFTAEGAGTLADPQAVARLDVNSLCVNGEQVGAVTATAEIAKQEVQFSFRVPAYNLTATGTSSIYSPYPAVIEVEALNTDLAQLPVYLPGFTGLVTARAEIWGNLDQWQDMVVQAQIEELSVRYRSMPICLDQPGFVEFANRRITIPRPIVLTSGNSSVQLSGDLPLDAAARPGEMRITGVIDLPTLISMLPPERQLLSSGQAHLDVSIQGSLERMEPAGSLTLAGGTLATADVRVPPLYNINLSAHIRGGEATIERLTADWGPATITAAGRLPLGLLPADVANRIAGARSGPLEFAADVDNVQLLAFQILPEQVAGVVSLRVEGSSPSLDLGQLQARATFRQLNVELGRYRIEQNQPATILVSNGVARIQRFVLTGPDTNLTLSGSAELSGAQSLDVVLEGTTDAAILAFMAPKIRAQGPAEIQIAASGTLNQPQVAGFVQVADAQLSLDEPRLAVENVQLRMELNGDRVNITTLRGVANGGTLTGFGGFRLAGGGVQDLNINVSAQGVFLEYPEGLRTVSNADLRLVSAGSQLALEGTVRIQEGTYRRDIFFDEQIMRRLRGGGPVDLGKEPNKLLQNLQLNIGVETVEPLVFDNNLIRAEVTANLRLVGTYNRPGLTGRLGIEEGGEIFLSDRRFIVEHAEITFVSEQRIEPFFDVLTRTEVTGYEISMQVTGEIGAIETTLTADDPSLTQSQVLALLLTGRRVDEAQAATTVVAPEQVLSLLAGTVTGRVTQQFEQILGLSTIRIDPSLIAPEVSPTARLTIGQDLSRRLSLIYSMDLADPGNQIWITEYDFSRRFFVRSIKQQDNSYRLEFRHDHRFGGAPFRPIDIRDERRIASVAFQGNMKFTSRELARRLGVDPDDRYDFFEIRNGLDRLEKQYVEAGFVESRIRLERSISGNRVDLVVHIIEGPHVDFVYEGWQVPQRVQEQVREQWRRGIFDTQRAEDSVALIEEALIRRRFLRPSVTYQIATPNALVKRVLFEIRPGIQYRDVRIVFEGANGLKPDQLRKALDDADLDVEIYTRGDDVAEFLSGYYRENGFLQAAVKPPIYQLDATTRTGKVLIPIQEGSRFRLGTIDFDGNTALTAGELRARISAQQGEVFTPNLRESIYSEVEDAYRDLGYVDTEITYTVTQLEDPPVVNLLFQINERQQRVVQSIEIKGTEYTSVGLVRSQLGFDVGDVLLGETLSRARRNLYLTGAFRLVEVEVVDLPRANYLPPNQRPVALQVVVEEVQPYQIRYGGYYDTERGPGFIADFKTYNTIGGARTLGLRARYDSDLQEARLYFGQPYLLRFPLKLTGVAFAIREVMDPFITDRIGFSVEAETRFRDHYLLTAGYRIERDSTREREPDPLFPFDVTTRVAPLVATLTRETRNDILEPTRGSFLSQAVEFAPDWLGSELRFVRSFTQYFRYFPLQEPVKVPFSAIRRPRLLYAVGVRAGLGSGLGGQELIPSERFFAGGGTTIRGFRQNRVGPMVAGEPVGGEAVFILNNELRFPIWRVFDGVAFVDMGNVYERWQDFNPFDVRKSAGFGLRIRTPFFMLRFDYGFKLDRRPGESIGQFFFSIGQAF